MHKVSKSAASPVTVGSLFQACLFTVGAAKRGVQEVAITMEQIMEQTWNRIWQNRMKNRIPKHS